MSAYGRIFTAIYDPFLAWGERAGMAALRRSVLADATGDVLEIGAGTGLNLEAYPAGLTSLTLADPEPSMVDRLRERAAGRSPAPRVDAAPAEELPYPDDAFDTVVSTLVLCTVTDVDAALAEIRRVLRPGGRLLVVEHVRAADDSALSGWQDRLHEPWRRFGYGCHCNRDTRGALTAVGFGVEGLSAARWPRMPPIVTPLISGTVTAPAT